MKIYKYPLILTDTQLVTMPAGAKILTVQVQRGVPCLWAICDETAFVHEERQIDIYGTGHSLPDNPGDYIGTFQISNGDLVFHAFECKEHA